MSENDSNNGNPNNNNEMDDAIKMFCDPPLSDVELELHTMEIYRQLNEAGLGCAEAINVITQIQARLLALSAFFVYKSKQRNTEITKTALQEMFNETMIAMKEMIRQDLENFILANPTLVDGRGNPIEKNTQSQTQIQESNIKTLH